MKSFKKWLNKLESFGGSAISPSSVDDNGEGFEGVVKNMSTPGAFPTYEIKKNKKKKIKQLRR